MENFLSAVMPIITQAVISILGILVTIAITQLSKYLTMKKTALIEKMGADQYSFYQSLAEAVYFGVEQQLKKAPGSDKKAEFDKRLLAKVPGLTQNDLDHLREAVVGKVRASATILLEKPEPVPVPYQPIMPIQPYAPSPVWYDTSPIKCTEPLTSTGGIITGTADATVITTPWQPHLNIPETPIIMEEPLEHEPEADK